MNGTAMDVRYFVNRNGFHIADLKPQGTVRQNRPQVVPVQKRQQPEPTTANRPVRNQIPLRQRVPTNRALNPSFSRPDLLTGERSIQPGK
jgi:hypothetical protein